MRPHVSLSGKLERGIRKLFLSLLRSLLPTPRDSDVSSERISSILVIRQHNQLGDMLCAVPLLRALREHYPNSSMTLVTSPVSHDVMIGNPYVDEVICFDKRDFVGRYGIRLTSFKAFLSRLRMRHYDLAVVPVTVSISTTSDLLAYLSGARIRIGPRSLESRVNRSSFLYNIPVDLTWKGEPNIHQAFRNQSILKPLQTKIAEPVSHIQLTDNEVEWAKSFLRKDKDHIGLWIAYHPGAGKIPNRWPADRFSLIANILSYEFDAKVLITSGPFDGDPVSDMKSKLSVPFTILANEPIRRVASVLSQVTLLITNDTGIMHVGAAVHVPVLSIFGPTNPSEWAPVGTENEFLKSQTDDISGVQIDEVLATARKMLRLILSKERTNPRAQ